MAYKMRHPNTLMTRIFLEVDVLSLMNISTRMPVMARSVTMLRAST